MQALLIITGRSVRRVKRTGSFCPDRHRMKSVSVDSQTDSSASADASSDPSTSAQQEGTLSPSSGTTFTDNSDDSLDNLLNQVQTLLPQDNGTWSVYVCNLSLDSERSDQ